MGEDLLKQLNFVKEKIGNTANESKREKNEVKLLPVSKNHSVDKINFFKSLGFNEFAESRVQELLKKNELIPDVHWHFIGHLQRNKVKYLMRLQNLKLIHSLDSWRLAKEINKRAAKNDRIIDVLLQVNVADESSKYGIDIKEVYDFLSDSRNLSNMRIVGMMTIAPYDIDSNELRSIFRRLYDKRSKMIAKGFDLKELSMGMSNDYQIAIEEGSTIVRIGSALFGKRGG
ncbi:YggS family pyridoxal phosphate-dependent enzyme [Natronospora cellulosivora (SeqCode)]